MTLIYDLLVPYSIQLYIISSATYVQIFKQIHHPNLNYHPETEKLLQNSIFCNGDLDILPSGSIFNATLGYPLSYPYTNFYTNPSDLTYVIITNLPRTYIRTDRQTSTNTIVLPLPGFRQVTNYINCTNSCSPESMYKCSFGGKQISFIQLSFCFCLLI